MNDSVMDDALVVEVDHPAAPSRRSGPLPTNELPAAPPPRSRLAGEWTTMVLPLRLLGRAPALLRSQRGSGRLVVDIPGWLTGSETMAPLRSYLRLLGHDAVAWGLGRNGSDAERTVERFIEQLERLVSQRGGAPAALVGWSLGGVVARETARERPDLVERVVTLGTPAQGGPTYTAGAAQYGARECARIAELQAEADRTNPLSMPITAVYTRRDGVVDWRACIDRWSTQVDHVEVRSSHFGLGIDPDVWAIVADALAGPAPTGLAA